MGLPILTNPKTLGKKKEQFNKLLNEYIHTQLADECWRETLLEDFNEIVQKHVFHDKFDASKYRACESSDPSQSVPILTEEQKEFLEKVRIEKGEDKWIL
jgi:CTP:phosphocholine cytidylyltransferase-like protein